ncbi:MAG: hypothetical protein H0X03_03520 [Nitrosopumilus sp.]|nr:hypothetical protein [Nitrosopumilus sp.]
MNQIENKLKKTLVIASFVLSFILAASLVSITSKHMASAIDLSSIKQDATSLLTGNNNSNTTNNNTTSTTDNSNSTGASLKQKATNAIGELIK